MEVMTNYVNYAVLMFV